MSLEVEEGSIAWTWCKVIDRLRRKKQRGEGYLMIMLTGGPIMRDTHTRQLRVTQPRLSTSQGLGDPDPDSWTALVGDARWRLGNGEVGSVDSRIVVISRLLLVVVPEEKWWCWRCQCTCSMLIA